MTCRGGSIIEARQAVLMAMATLRAVEKSGDGQSKIEGFRFLRMLRRQSEHDALVLLADAERAGEFADRGIRPANAVADIARCRPVEARRMVALAGSVFPTTLDGQPLEPELPATAAALGGFEIDQAHAEVIERALHTEAARRIPPEQWAGLETQLAELARQHRPDELAHLARQLIEVLDQDGPAPDEGEPQINELYLAKSRHGVGGRITGRLDAPTFEVMARAIRAHLMPGDDGHASLGARWCWVGIVSRWMWAGRNARPPWRSVGPSPLGTVDVLILVVIARHTAAKFTTFDIGSTAAPPTSTTS
jgi:5-methylcytosine-specific restriction protein A